MQEYPFRSVLSLKPLIDYLQEALLNSDGAESCVLEDLTSKLARAPELLEPIEDLTVLERHPNLLRTLMFLIFPLPFWETEAVTALVPLGVRVFYRSPPADRLLVDEKGLLQGRTNLDEKDFAAGRVIRAYSFILEKFYGIRQNLDWPLIRTVQEPQTGLDRHFKINLNFRFLDVHPVGELKELSDEERARVLDHLTEPEVIREILPPENFEFRGFTLAHAVDVTESEVLSALERDLIDQDAFISQTGFLRLQERLRTLFHSPDLVAGLAALQDEQVLLLNKGCEMTCNCIFVNSQHVPIAEFDGSVFKKAAQSGQIVLVKDLNEESSRTKAEEELLANGVRSLLVAPLIFQGEILGTLDIGSPHPGGFGPIDRLRLKQIQPLFAIAMKRALEDLNNNVQGVIKEKCTAVHPSVEWRFRHAAFHHLERLRSGRPSELEPIVFRDVYPLYGASDIRGSSDLRNRAVQEDLVEHLHLALEVIRWAGQAKPLPILQVLAHRIDNQLDRIRTALGSGDEISMVGFLKREVEPFFTYLRQFGPRVSRAIEAYESAVDPILGTVYAKRKEFEESVSRFNETISTYLDREETEAQQIFPHYFEKRKTDGIDYLVYIGESMVENGDFNELHVKNLRLWQLMVACGIAWKAEQMKSWLKVPVETTNLILAQDSPISIRFRFDEKRFDVDGAYDIRHEIIKSRIDKAMIKGQNERLTQPGRIAIVYSRPQEAREIRQYIDYLQAQGYLTRDLESLEVADLPGVQGLRALRVGVNLESQMLSERVERLAG